MEFIVFTMYYIILKGFIMLINLETRRSKMHVPAAVSGLLS